MPETSSNNIETSTDRKRVVDPEHPVPPATMKSIGVAVIVVGLVAMVVASFMLATDIILILFLGLLFGVFLHRLSKLVASQIPVSRSWCLGIVTALLLLLSGGGLGLFGFQINQQIETAESKIDEGAQKLLAFADRNATARSIIRSTPYVKDLLISAANNGTSTGSYLSFESDEKSAKNSDEQSSGKQSNDSQTRNDPVENEAKTEEDQPETEASQVERESFEGAIKPIKSAASQAASVVGKVFGTTLGLVVNSVLIFFTGLFLATNPDSYRDGVVRLFPPARRTRVEEIMNQMGDSMWSWLLGRFGSMLITGLGAGVILGVMGVPMAISLGIATGLLAFIPNIGGAIAFLFAFLVALSQGLTTALWLIPAFLVLQLLESYIATPLIQQKQVSIPPALLIAFQAVFGVIFGFLGAAVASPMLAAIKVGVEEAYIKDVLENESEQSSIR